MTSLGDARARVHDPSKEEGCDPRGLAAFFGHPEAVKVLLEYGADVNHKPPSRFANTAVDAAVSGDHADVVRILLAAGANPKVRSEGNFTHIPQDAGAGDTDRIALPLCARPRR